MKKLLRFRRKFIAGILASMLPNGAFCATQVDIYMIGNSYTVRNGTDGTYHEVVKFAMAANNTYGTDFRVTERTAGGKRMFEHNKELGGAALAAGGYEHIILQEQSQLLALAYDSYGSAITSGSNFFTEFDRPYVNPWTELDRTDTYVDQVYFGWDAMLNKIVNNSPTSSVQVFQTWGRLGNNNTYNAGSREEHLRRNVLMSDDISDEALIKGLDAQVARVGEAWDDIYDNNPSLNLYDNDGSHANDLGHYLAAATIFQNILNEELAGVSVADLGYNPYGTNGDILMSAAMLQSGVVVVPEPTSVLLTLFGLFLLTGRRRRIH